MLIFKYVFFGFVFAFMIHLMPVIGCGKDEEDPIPEDPITTLDLVKANKAAEEVEQAFATGDAAKIMPFMAPAALTRSMEDIQNASPTVLKQFAVDFNNRTELGHGDEIIEYSFNWNGQAYTVDFALQDDGSIKIIRL